MDSGLHEHQNVAKGNGWFRAIPVLTLKEGVTSAPRVLNFLHGDHPSTSLRAGLGSVSLTTDANGQKLSEQPFDKLRAGCYKPYGEDRWASGADMPTDKRFTGQMAQAAGYVGSLYDYSARFYSPALGRFVSADTIVPGAGNPQALNRYMYVLGRPLSFGDPDGHCTPLLWWLCYAVSKSPSFFALAPDLGGLVQPVANSYSIQRHASESAPAIVLGAAVAVQAEYCCSVGDFVSTAILHQDDPSLGIAQVRQKSEMDAYGIGGTPLDPDASIRALSAKIQRSGDACSGCDATDKFIVAGLAQNGFAPEEVAKVQDRYGLTGRVDWGGYFAGLLRTAVDRGGPVSQIKSTNEWYQAGMGSRAWNLQILRKFVINADALRKLGWQMPADVDLGYVNCLVNDGGATCKR